MIPALIEEHLRVHHQGYGHTLHAPAMTAQDLAAAEHVPGRRVAKAVIVRVGGELAIAVVPASTRVSLAAIEEATGRTAELAPEPEFSRIFEPCEPGAEPPLGLFGLPIFVDQALLQQDRLVMPAGTHDDAVEVDTHEWLTCEGAQPVPSLGARLS